MAIGLRRDELIDVVPDAPLASAQQIAARLHVTPVSADNLLRCGLLGTVYSDGRTRYALEFAVSSLARRSTPAGKLPPALWARPGPPVTAGPDDTTRIFSGWHAAASTTVRKDGVDRWWRIQQADRIVGELFVVSVAGFVTEVYRVRKLIGRDDSGRWHLGLVAAKDTDARRYRDIRLPAQQGGRLLRYNLPLPR